MLEKLSHRKISISYNYTVQILFQNGSRRRNPTSWTPAAAPCLQRPRVDGKTSPFCWNAGTTSRPASRCKPSPSAFRVLWRDSSGKYNHCLEATVPIGTRGLRRLESVGISRTAPGRRPLGRRKKRQLLVLTSAALRAAPQNAPTPRAPTCPFIYMGLMCF
jgi:hypothetical protein